MKIFIDADGCPVVDLTIDLAKEFNVECFIVCDTSHVFQKEGAQTITVSKGADSADFKIANLINKSDIVITQDYGLAAMCLSRGAVPVSQNGFVYDDSNIEALLLQRYTSKKLRMSGKRLKGNKKRTDDLNVKFVKTLRDLLMNKFS